MKVYQNILQTIGNTPIVRLNNIEKLYNLNNKLYAKIEFFNPGGSVKDRIALEMLSSAFKENKINKDSVIIEPTSGNTGIGLAMACASLNLRIILTMPETMSKERIAILKAYGAEVILTDGSKGMSGSVEKANQLSKEIKNSFIPSQFDNLNNPKIHYKTTAKEIYDDLDGNIDIFIAGVGTGGTISGIGKYLKEKNKNIKIIAVEPLSSPLLSKGVSGSHKIQGIGANFIPNTLDTNIYDEIITISNEDAFKYGKLMATKEGILVGISSGAVLSAAINVSNREEYKNKNIVILLPDTGSRYLSTDLFK